MKYNRYIYSNPSQHRWHDEFSKNEAYWLKHSVLIKMQTFAAREVLYTTTHTLTSTAARREQLDTLVADVEQRAQLLAGAAR